MKKYHFIFKIACLSIVNCQFTIVNSQSVDQLQIQLHQLEEEKQKNTESLKLLEQEIEDLKILLHKEWMLQYGLPKKGNENKTITHHLAYALQYNEKHEQADWVIHVLPVDVITGKFGRTNEFKIDSLIATGTAVKDDYWYSGFDRGHLAPSADFRWSSRAINESYLYSNISPQRAELNRERWAEMEDLLRSYVIKTNHPLLIVTGPILKDSLPYIGKENKISIPEYYFKVAIDFDDTVQSGIAFIMPNKFCEYPPMSYAVSIDSLEKLTGIDFFPELTVEKEKNIESKFIESYWQKLMDEGNIDPIDPKDLPKDTYNTVMARYQVGNKITVCGTVVSTKFSEKSGATFINLDRKFPNQIFTINIWKDDRKNFSYLPEVLLNNQSVCVTGKISLYQDVPAMTVTSEESVEIIDIQSDDD